MFGVTLKTYTLFHTDKMPHTCPTSMSRPCRLQFVDRAGHVLGITMRRQDMSIVRCFAQMDSWLNNAACWSADLFWDWGNCYLSHMPEQRTDS